jgi:uncharacterized membrane protein YphA (DoxX/SURF4 family)
MDKVVLVVRILMGLMLTLFGAHKIVEFLPAPEMDPSSADTIFFMALLDTGYMMIFIGIVELLAGILLLAGRYIPLALVIIFPVSLNILLFHLILNPPSLAGPGLALFVMNVFLAWHYREHYSSLLKA